MFVYYNSNPAGLRIGDCVIRAISTALDLDYYEVLELLMENSEYFNCDMLVSDCYNILLQKTFNLPKLNGKQRTVKEIVEQYPDCILILRIDGHLTCAKYGLVYDIWDTTNEIVDVFWIVSE